MKLFLLICLGVFNFQARQEPQGPRRTGPSQVPSRCIPADTGEAWSQEGPCSRRPGVGLGRGGGMGGEDGQCPTRGDRDRQRQGTAREGGFGSIQPEPIVPEATPTARICFVMIKCFVFCISYFELVSPTSNRKTSLINKSSALRIIVLGPN